MRFKTCLNASILVALYPAMALVPAQAQEAGPARGTTAGGLEEIIVTAQKRQEVLLEVPIAISAFTSDAMRNAGVVQLSDFLQTAPGVGIIDAGTGQQSIQIRGINSVYGDALVGYYLDELPFTLMGNTQLPDVRTYDLERIEVLRGPQGTLYGDGSLGGTIRILTYDPDLSSMQGGAELIGSGTSGGDESYAVKGMFNMPIKQDVAGLRLVATYEDIGGWIDNTATGESNANTREITNYRGKFRWKPTERLDMVFSGWHTEQDTVGTSSSLDDETFPFPSDTLDSEYDLYGATIRYSFDSFDLVSATSMMDYSALTKNVLFGQFEFTDDTQQDILTQELRLTSTGEGIFRWTAGFFYRSIERDTFAELAAFAFTQDLSFDSDSYAVFGETTWSLLDRKLDLTLGLRYFEDDRKVSEEIAPALLQVIQSIDPTYTGKVDETFDTLNPRFNVSYRPNDDWLVYGNVAKGFRTGQPQPALSLGLAILSGVEVPTGIDPETLWSYEIGTKARLAEGRVVLEAAAYYNDWEDLQVPVVVAQGVRALVNGGTGKTQGFELAASWLPIDGLTLQATGSFVDATFTESVDGININDGDDIPGVPDRTLTASATYRWPFAANMNGFAFSSVQYNSERTDTVNAVPPSDDIVLLDLRLGVEGEKWAAYLYGENLTDEYGAIDVYSLGATGPALRPRPLSFGLQLSVSF